MPCNDRIIVFGITLLCPNRCLHRSRCYQTRRVFREEFSLRAFLHMIFGNFIGFYWIRHTGVDNWMGRGQYWLNLSKVVATICEAITELSSVCFQFEDSLKNQLELFHSEYSVRFFRIEQKINAISLMHFLMRLTRVEIITLSVIGRRWMQKIMSKWVMLTANDALIALKINYSW